MGLQHRHVLLGIASSCLNLQAGDKVKALKCLIRSGDTDKIIFFAGVSRHAEIYTLAANYLQTLDWHARPDLAQSIVTFYSKVSSCTLRAVKPQNMQRPREPWSTQTRAELVEYHTASACRNANQNLVRLRKAEPFGRCTYTDCVKVAHGTCLWY